MTASYLTVATKLRRKGAKSSHLCNLMLKLLDDQTLPPLIGDGVVDGARDEVGDKVDDGKTCT